jgi:tetratricopeptide (TPR) repeat protein
MATLEGQLRELAGRLDEIEHTLGRRVETELADFRQMLSTLQGRLPPPALVPQKFLEEDEGRAQGFPEEVAQPLAEVFLALRSGNYSRAREALVLAEQFARGSYLKEILFWKAVTLEGLGEFRTALSIYHELAVAFPKDSRAAAVLLRQAQVLVRLGDAKTAALILKKLMADWPKASEAALARDRLKELK